MDNYEEFTYYWLKNNNTILIKFNFNDDINMLNFNNIISLVFINFKEIKHYIENEYHQCSISNKLISYFNQSVDNLPQSLQNLTFGYYFNQSVDNLPNSLIKIEFYNFGIFNKELNCLSNLLTVIKLPKLYYQEIKQIPSNLKEIICSSSYKYINLYSNIDYIVYI